MISPKLIPAILLAIAALRGESICGKDDRSPTPNVDLIQVSCIDFDRLRAQAPDFRWPVGKVTQVLVRSLKYEQLVAQMGLHFLANLGLQH